MSSRGIAAFRSRRVERFTLHLAIRGRNLDKLRFALKRLGHVGVDLGTKTLRVVALCGINRQESSPSGLANRPQGQSTGFLRNLCAFLACFRQTDRNRLLAARHLSSRAALTRAKRAPFLSPYSALDTLSRGEAILPAVGLTRPRGFLRLHHHFSSRSACASIAPASLRPAALPSRNAGSKRLRRIEATGG
jgi:hypothetical protein